MIIRCTNEIVERRKTVAVALQFTLTRKNTFLTACSRVGLTSTNFYGEKRKDFSKEKKNSRSFYIRVLCVVKISRFHGRLTHTHTHTHAGEIRSYVCFNRVLRAAPSARAARAGIVCVIKKKKSYTLIVSRAQRTRTLKTFDRMR